MTLQEITGQKSISAGIQDSLEPGSIITVNIEGPSGSGKSWLLQDLTTELSEKQGCILKLQGDGARTEEIYYPLNVFIEKANKSVKKSITAGKKLVSEIPVIGNAAESFLEEINLQSFYRDNKDFEAFGLHKHRPFSTHLISVLNKYKTVAVLCDDVQDFDHATLVYLDNLIKYLNSRNFECCVLFLFCYNTDKELGTQTGWLSKHHYSYKIEKIARPNLMRVLILLGLKHTLDDPELDLVYSSTGGHLHVLRTVVAYLNKNHDNNLLISQDKNLLRSLLNSRLQQIQQHYSLVKDLLLTLAGLGKSGSKAELLCLIENKDDLPELIKYAEDLDFIFIKDGYLHFSHDVVKDYVVSLESRKKASFYRKFSDCLRALNPSNYLRRAWAEDMAGNTDKADVYRCLYLLQRMRLGFYDEINELSNLFKSEEAERYKEIAEAFSICYQHNSTGSLSEGLLSLSNLPFDLPQELLAEKVYLECEILLKHTDYSSRKEALQKLESWEILKDEEPEQWYRFSHLRLLANAELGNFEQAMRIEQEIAIYFTKRANYDISAKEILNRLNLFSEIVYSPDIAHVKLSQTLHNLKREIERENYDKLLDYYISLCNLAGNCLSTNRLTLSLEYGRKALTLVKDFPQVNFPHKEAALNNLLLASHFLKVEEPEIIHQTYDGITKDGLEEDRILLNSNHAGILLRQGKNAQALTLLKEASRMVEFGYTDPFYLYHQQINFALALYLTGEKADALKILDSTKKLEGQINNKLTHFYKKHHDILFELLSENETYSYDQLCEVFNKRQPKYLSVVWEKFKPVYLFTDLQIWTNN